MAERRMFAKSVINSARFLRLPQTSRLLYYDLGMAADDDGVVEAFTVIRMTGAAEEDLQVLVEKGFLTVLNEDLVAHITDWSRNNYIRPDRYNPSAYRELLVGLLGDYQTDTNGIPLSDQRDTQDRLGKDRLGKDSTGKGRQGEERAGEAEGPPPPPPPGRAEAYFREKIDSDPSPSSMETLGKFEKELGTDVCIRAIDEAMDYGKRYWGYVCRILMEKREKGVRSMGDWERVEAEFRAGKEHPNNPFLQMIKKEEHEAGQANPFFEIAREIEARQRDEEDVVSVQDDPPPF